VSDNEIFSHHKEQIGSPLTLYSHSTPSIKEGVSLSRRLFLILSLAITLPGLIILTLIINEMLTQIELEMRCVEIYIEYLGIVVQAIVLAYYLGRLRRSPDIVMSMGPALSRKGYGKFIFQRLFKISNGKTCIADDDWELLRIPGRINKVDNKLQLTFELPDITITNVGEGLAEIRGLFIESVKPARLVNGEMRALDIRFEISSSEDKSRSYSLDSLENKIEEHMNEQIKGKGRILKQNHSLTIDMKNLPLAFQLDGLIDCRSVYILKREGDRYCFLPLQQSQSLSAGSYIAAFLEIELRVVYMSIEPGKVEMKQRVIPFALIIEAEYGFKITQQ